MSRILVHAAAAPAVVALLAGGSCSRQQPTYTPTVPSGPRGPVVGYITTSNTPGRPCPRTATRIHGDCIIRFALRIRDAHDRTVVITVSKRTFDACQHSIYPDCVRKA